MAFDKLKYRISADASEFRSELKKANTAFERFQRDNRRSIRAIKRGVQTAAVATAALGTALAGAAINSSAKFERSLVSAGSKAQATAEQLMQMKQAALEASGASEFSAKDAADAMGFLAQAGFSVSEQMKALPGVLNLASAGELELAEAADIASNVLSGFGKSVEETARVNDLLVQAANNSNTSVRQLGDALSFAAPSAAGAGISMEETAAAIGKLSDAGIQGGRAGRSFNQILAQMQDAAKKLGVNLSSAEIQSLGFAGSLERLEKAGLTAGNAGDYFTERAKVAAQALLNQGIPAVSELNQVLETAGGTAERVAKEKIDTLSGSLNVLKGNIDNLLIVVGDQFKPLVQGTAEEMATLADNARGNSKQMSALRDGLIDMTEGLGTFVNFIGWAGEGMSHLIGVLFELGNAVQFSVGGLELMNGALKLQRGLMTQNASLIKEAAEELISADKRIRESGDSFGTYYEEATKKGEKFREGAEKIRGVLDSIAARARKAAQGINDLRDAMDIGRSRTDTAVAAGGSTPAELAELLGDTGPRLTGRDDSSTSTGGTSSTTSTTSTASKAVDAAKKQRQELERWASSIRSKVTPASEKLTQAQAKLTEAFKAELLNEGEFEAAMQMMFEQFDQATIQGEKLRKESERLTEQLSDVGNGQFVENLRKLRSQFDAGTISVDEFRRGLEGVGEAAEAYATLKRGADQLKDSLRTPFEEARDAIAAYREMRDQGLISQGQFEQAATKARESTVPQSLKDFRDQQAQQAQQWKQTWESAGQQLTSTLSTAVGDVFLDSLLGKTEDVREALKGLAKQMLLLAARAAIFKGLESAGFGADSSIANAIGGFASGGYVSGPGTSTSDSITARLSDGEYVMPAKAVDHFGLGFMDAIRGLKMPAAGRPQRFASGGLAKSTGGGLQLQINNITDPKEIERVLASSAGKRIVMNHMRRSSTTVNKVSNKP